MIPPFALCWRDTGRGYFSTPFSDFEKLAREVLIGLLLQSHHGRRGTTLVSAFFIVLNRFAYLTHKRKRQVLLPKRKTESIFSARVRLKSSPVADEGQIKTPHWFPARTTPAGGDNF